MRSKAIPMTKTVAADLYRRAVEAGNAAAAACTPTPMIVQERASPVDDSSPVVQQWHVPDGVCGFGWVEIRPSRGGFATYCRDNRIGRHSDYNRCHMISSPLRTQSYERNTAWARGFAAVLRDAGIDAYGTGRVD